MPSTCCICSRPSLKSEFCSDCHKEWTSSYERLNSISNETSRSLAKADFVRRVKAEERSAKEQRIAAQERAAKEKRPKS